MLRMLIVAPSHPLEVRTGRGVAFARLAQRISSEAEVRMVLGYTGDRAALPPGSLGVDMTGSRRLSTLRLWRAAREACSDLRPHVVLVSGLSLPPLGWPTIAAVRDLVGNGWEPLERGPWLRFRARGPRRVVVPTQSAREAVKRAGVSPWRVVRIPDAVPVPDAPIPLDASDVLRLLHPGTIHPAKGQHLSIDAVSRLPLGIRERFHLTVAGPVADARYLSQLRVAARGQPVDILPEQRELGDALASSDLVLYPTALDEEGWPDAAIEAMAAGRPVVWPDRAALREVLDGQGVPVTPGDVGALRRAILTASETDLVTLGHHGQAFVRDRYSWERIGPNWRMLLSRFA